jgi:hypothetical protein
MAHASQQTTALLSQQVTIASLLDGVFGKSFGGIAVLLISLGVCRCLSDFSNQVVE